MGRVAKRIARVQVTSQLTWTAHLTWTFSARAALGRARHRQPGGHRPAVAAARPVSAGLLRTVLRAACRRRCAPAAPTPRTRRARPR
ncbi:hypothetical protein ACFC09_16445 [Streptomyces sp. NPDC056161]|uniref:hypothetical protein n=1 Tax=Streptomyces sp. NPDC056161 TaxID=3345732 RepID=UPI0035D953DD